MINQHPSPAEPSPSPISTNSTTTTTTTKNNNNNNNSNRRRKRPTTPITTTTKLFLLILITTVFLPPTPTVGSSSIRSSNQPRKRVSSSDSPSSTNKDNSIVASFIRSSPLSVAAVCRDGVALLALHTQGADDGEPLLLSPSENNHNDDDDTEDNSNVRNILLDLPRTSRGPLRIEPVDAFGSAVLAVGWRTDAMKLADVCRSLAEEENMVYGSVVAVGGTGVVGGGGEYGHRIAQGLNDYMADCKVSDGVRELHALGLVATVGRVSSSSNDSTNASTTAGCLGGGHLWLVDATGAYPCRAHAVGYGSNRINRRLFETSSSSAAKRHTTKRNNNDDDDTKRAEEICFETLSVEDGARVLLDIVLTEINASRNNNNNNNANGDGISTEEDDDGWKVPPLGTRVEIAVVDSNQRKLRRLRQPFGLDTCVTRNDP